MNKKRLSINLVANVLSFLVSTGISFFLTPFITATLGSEAYGFVALGNNLVGYTRIITAAINAMAARFITINIYEKKELEAKQYFSSVIAANMIISVVLLIPAVLILIYIETFFNIQNDLVSAVQMMWGLKFLAFFVSIVTSVFGCATFVKNRLDLSARRDIISNILRAIFLLAAFAFLPPHLWYIGAAFLIAEIYITYANIGYTKRLLPLMKFKREYFSLKAIKDLLHSGVWNSVSMLSSTLLSGLDLLIANLFISGEAMGVLAIAKVIPMAFNTFVTQVQSVFIPDATRLHAEKNNAAVVHNLTIAVKLLGIISIVPLSILLVFGGSFFRLWVPAENSHILHILLILTVGTLIVSSSLKPLYAIFIITDKVRLNSLTSLGQGILSTVIVLLLLWLLPASVLNNETVPWGLYIIAGVSSVLGIIKAVTFLPILAARCLSLKRRTFYPALVRTLINLVIQIAVCYGVYRVLPSDTWGNLLLCAAVAGPIVLVLSLFMILNKNERQQALTMVKNRLAHTHQSK